MINGKRYYIAEVNEQNGDREYTHTIRFATAGNPTAVLDAISQDWYPGLRRKEMEIGDGNYSFSGGVVCWTGEIVEVSKATYDTLTIITELSRPAEDDPRPYFNHMCGISFAVISRDPTGENLTSTEILAALKRRVADLEARPEELIEAVGMPSDTYQEDPSNPSIFLREHLDST